MTRALLLTATLATLTGAGCLRSTSYKCSSSDQCGAGGVCEATGFCSFSDTGCTSGRRYGDLSGSYGNKCTDEVTPDIDSGVIVDGPPTDVPLGNCPASYNVTHNGHRYRVIANLAIWDTQAAACAADGANKYLAIPDDQAELTAIIAAANTANIWVGINDQTTEGSYTTTKNAAFSSTSTLWGSGEPNNMPVAGGGQADCTAAVMSTSRLVDDKCASTYEAVCECEP